MSSMAAAAARCRSLTARALARPALANHRGLSRPTLVANHRLLAGATTTTTTTAASGLQLNIPSAVAELEIEHERYEKALAENDVDVLDLLFLKDESTLRFGADGAQFGYSAIAAMRANRRPPGPREILSTSITTFGHDYGVANREFRRGADPRIALGVAPKRAISRARTVSTTLGLASRAAAWPTPSAVKKVSRRQESLSCTSSTKERVQYTDIAESRMHRYIYCFDAGSWKNLNSLVSMSYMSTF